MKVAALSALIAALAGAGSVIGEEVKLAERSVPSGSGRCYYECPTYNDQQSSSAQTFTPQYSSTTVTSCSYPDGAYCAYYTETGARYNGYTNCAMQAQLTTCTTDGNPDTNRYFKRDLALSPSEKRIRALQYNPTRDRQKRTLQYKQKLDNSA